MPHQTTDTRATLAVRLSADQRSRLAEIAQRENRTLSGEVRHLIDRRIEEYGSDPKAIAETAA